MRSVHGHHVDPQSQTEDDETDKDKEDIRPATDPNPDVWRLTPALPSIWHRCISYALAVVTVV